MKLIITIAAILLIASSCKKDTYCWACSKRTTNEWVTDLCGVDKEYASEFSRANNYVCRMK